MKGTVAYSAKRILKPLLLLSLLLLVHQANAQNDSLKNKSLLRYELGSVYGKTLDIHSFFPDVSNAFGFEFSILKQTSGKKYWHQLYKYPVFGVSLLGIGLGNDSILGQAIGAYYFKEFPKKIGRRFEWNSRIGLGLAYFTKIYDPFDNPDNYVIGSRITALAVGQTGLGFHLTNKLSIYGRMAFIHYSNGHFSVPNIGANIISGIFSIKYIPSTNDFETKTHEVLEVDKKWRLNVDFGMGLHEIEGTVLPTGGPKYPVYFGSIYTSKRIKNKAVFSTGFNLNYFTAFHDFIINQQIFDSNEKAKSYKGVIFIGYEWLFGRIGFLLQPGFNVYYPFRKELIKLDLINNSSLDVINSNLLAFKYYTRSTRQSLRYNPFIGIGLRTIGGKADFIETRVGMAF